MASVAKRLAERVGLELPAWVIEARTAARIAALELTPAEYVALIESGRGSAELDELVESVRVGESRLFRHRSQITALADIIAPQLRAKGKRTVRVWSAGCSTGEEPFTLAVVLAKALPGVAIAITATDISEDALANAITATYPLAALADVPAPWRDGFVVDGEVVRVRPELAALVRFERGNLVDCVPPRGCDVVWCRNVLIYFTPAARRRVVEKLMSALAPNGTIFVGYSESLRDVPELASQRMGETVFYVKREADRITQEIAVTKTPAFGVPVRSGAEGRRGVVVDAKTPPPVIVPKAPPPSDVLVLRGQPTARAVAAELTVRLGLPGLRSLTIDLDGAELLPDDLAAVLRRAVSAAGTAGVTLELRATRTGARRWLVRHGLFAEETDL